MEGVLLNKGYTFNSAMDMQNKQIRQPGSQAESEIIRNCIRHRPEAEPNQSCRSIYPISKQKCL